MSDDFIGEIRLFGFPRVPSGWLACNGQLLPISGFDALFALIGTIYGGDGQQTFQLPDLRGRLPIGQGQGPGLPSYALGQRAGSESYTLTDPQMPRHSHALISSTATCDATTPSADVHLGAASSGNLYAPSASQTTYKTMAPAIAPAGASLPHNNMMPTLVANYCICYLGVFPSSG